MFGYIGYARYSAKAASGTGAQLRQDEYRRMEVSLLLQILISTIHPLVTRLTSDVTIIQNAFAMGTRPFMRGPIMLVAAGLLYVYYEPRAGSVFCRAAFLAIALFFIVKVLPFVPRYARRNG